jgi:hypothetical protein
LRHALYSGRVLVANNLDWSVVYPIRPSDLSSDETAWLLVWLQSFPMVMRNTPVNQQPDGPTVRRSGDYPAAKERAKSFESERKKQQESTVDSKRFSAFKKIDGLDAGHFVGIFQCV